MNEEILQKLGYNNVAFRMLLKRYSEIDAGNIIMPGRKKSINDSNDANATEISLDNIYQQFQTLVQTIQSLPNVHNDDDYFGRLKSKLISRLFDVGLSIGSLQTQAGMDSEDITDFINNKM